VSSSLAFHALGPVACCDLVPEFEGPSQRSSSVLLVTKNSKWDPGVGHSKSMVFPFRSVNVYETHDWPCI
jgi:hypothetical protein